MRARSRKVARSPSFSTGTITRAPAPRNVVTTAAPRPPAPPVMMATLPSSVLMAVSLNEMGGRRPPESDHRTRSPLPRCGKVVYSGGAPRARLGKEESP